MANKDKTLMKRIAMKPKEADKKVLSFFVLGFPVVIMVAIGLLIPIRYSWWALLLLVAYELVLIKQFLDSYYHDEDLFD